MGKRQEEMKKLGEGEVLQLCWTKGKSFPDSTCSTCHAVCAVECRSRWMKLWEPYWNFPLLGRPPFCDTRWQNTDRVCRCPPQANEAWARPWRASSEPLHDHMGSRRKQKDIILNTYAASQHPETFVFLNTHLHLINKKVKTLASLASSSSALRKSVSLTRLAFLRW